MAKSPATASPSDGRSKFLGELRTAHGCVPADDRQVVRRFVTESISLNRICGVGGVPVGVPIVVHGPFRGGKSTTAARIGGDVARKGGIVFYGDVERAVVRAWFDFCGLAQDAYALKRPRTQEEMQDSVTDFCIRVRDAKKAGDLPDDIPCLAVVDTISKMCPADMLSGKIGSRNYGLQANLFNDWSKVLIVVAEEAGVIPILVSAERKDPDAGDFVPDWQKFRPTTGVDVDYVASVTLRIAYGRSTKEGSGDDAVKTGKHHDIWLRKSKFGPDSTTTNARASFFTSNGRGKTPVGIDVNRELLAEGLDLGVLRKAPKQSRVEATWDPNITWPTEQKFFAALREDGDLYAEIFGRAQDVVETEAEKLGHVLR